MGTLASGFPEELNRSSDLIYTNTDIQPVNDGQEVTQYFWEAFPAGAGPGHRTTYLFSYLDAGVILCDQTALHFPFTAQRTSSASGSL